MLNDIDDRLCGLGDVRWKKFLETANWLCHFHMGQAGRLLIKFRIDPGPAAHTPGPEVSLLPPAGQSPKMGILRYSTLVQLTTFTKLCHTFQFPYPSLFHF